MKAGKYSIKDLFVNRYIQRIIVPEIQRDYVWGETQVNGLLFSIVSDYRKYIDGDVPQIISNNEIDIEAFSNFYKKRNYASNIGFIYAYSDPSYEGRYFLIDGQQRVTTLYLLLAVLANRNQPLREVFAKNYCNNHQLKLGYKVRNTANELLNKFINHIVNQDTDVSDQSWLLNSYKRDITGKSIINNYYAIQSFLDNIEIDNEKNLFNYIEELTEFWYFDTNVSEQGEELYIYMNARGEHMQSNENIKADLLSKLDKIDDKNYYGEKWENWQDLFWKNRNTNNTADIGFNQFLTCIAGLEYYLKEETNHFYSKEQFDGIKDGATGIKLSDVLKVIDIHTIEQYFKTFEFLLKESKNFTEVKRYSDWIDAALTDFWKLFNDRKNPINWFADYRDKNRNTERNAMVYIWSVLLYIKTKLSQDNDLYKHDTIRFFRRMYVRFKNNNRSVSTIKSHVDITLINGVIDDADNVLSKNLENNKSENSDELDKTVLTNDEIFKNKILLNFQSENDQKLKEELIWEIEDHPYNLVGRDVGNINFSHLCDADPSDVDIKYLERIKNKFQELFPKKESQESQVKLIEVLLQYGSFYDKVSPYYYSNYKLNNWKRVIRNIGTEIINDNSKPFKTFFKDFFDSEDSFELFHQKKTKIKQEKENTKTIRDMIIWYSQNIGQSMWSQGFNIAISNGSPCRLKDWDKKDEIFHNSFKFYNIKGDLKGGNPEILSELLKENSYAN